MFFFFSSDDLPKKKPPLLYKPSNPDTLAYLDFSVSTTGMLAGVKVNTRSPRYQLWFTCLHAFTVYTVTFTSARTANTLKTKKSCP